MIIRRRFLSAATQTTIGAMAFTTMNWSKTEAATRLSKIGLQLYTVRTEMAKDFEGSLKRVAELGYSEVEFAGYYNRAPKDVRAILDRYKLAAPAAHVPLKDVQANLDQTIEAAQVIGHKFLICPYLEDKDRRSLDDYKRHAATFNKAGEACQKAGIQFGYHNHDFEFQSFGGKMAYDQLLADTDPKLVTMELDLYWIVKASQDPLAYMAKYPGRFTLFHVKEMDKTDKRGITEVGRGVIDFKTIFAKSKGAIKHYFVEQDTSPGSPFDSIKVSIDYLKQLEF
ncbi:MAG: sugar phosphate isomerase/epimerase family protein [Blastocatellia bacterium]